VARAMAVDQDEVRSEKLILSNGVGSN
jgi:hypothetical protein